MVCNSVTLISGEPSRAHHSCLQGSLPACSAPAINRAQSTGEFLFGSSYHGRIPSVSWVVLTYYTLEPISLVRNNPLIILFFIPSPPHSPSFPSSVSSLIFSSPFPSPPSPSLLCSHFPDPIPRPLPPADHGSCSPGWPAEAAGGAGEEGCRTGAQGAGAPEPRPYRSESFPFNWHTQPPFNVSLKAIVHPN